MSSRETMSTPTLHNESPRVVTNDAGNSTIDSRSSTGEQGAGTEEPCHHEMDAERKVSEEWNEKAGNEQYQDNTHHNEQNNDDSDDNDDDASSTSSSNITGEALSAIASAGMQPCVPGPSDLEKHQTAASMPMSLASEPESYPEGGLQAWLVVAGAWFGMFSSMGIVNTLATLQAYTLEHQLKGYSEGTVGWVFSVYVFLTFFCGVYIGPVFDKYGPKWLVAAGAVCIVTGIVATSFCTELWHFILSFGILCGLGTSLLFTPCIAAVGHWFRARRGFATGIASTAGGVGGIVYPLMLTSLFERVGYGWALRILALICLVCSSIGVLLVRSRLPPAANARAHPDLRIFRQVPFLLITIGIFLLEFSLFIPLTYVSSYAIHAGFSQTFAYQLLPIMNAGSAIGRILPGYYADIVGPFNVCFVSVVISLVSCLCVWLPAGHTTPGIVIFSILFGFSSGTAIAIVPVCVGQMCKTQNYGRYYATCYTVVSFACLIGVPIAGSIVQADGGGYTGLIIFTSAIYVGSMVFLFLAKVKKLGWKRWLSAY